MTAFKTLILKRKTYLNRICNDGTLIGGPTKLEGQGLQAIHRIEYPDSKRIDRHQICVYHHWCEKKNTNVSIQRAAGAISAPRKSFGEPVDGYQQAPIPSTEGVEGTIEGRLPSFSA